MDTYNDDMEAYVFDTKSDLILGNFWLRQVQPVPDWFQSSWSIKLNNGNVAVIKPLKQIFSKHAMHTHDEVIQDSSVGNDGTKGNDGIKDDEMIDGDNLVDYHGFGELATDYEDVENCDFVITARQFEKLLKKQQVAECFLVSAKRFINYVI